MGDGAGLIDIHESKLALERGVTGTHVSVVAHVAVMRERGREAGGGVQGLSRPHFHHILLLRAKARGQPRFERWGV